MIFSSWSMHGRSSKSTPPPILLDNAQNPRYPGAQWSVICNGAAKTRVATMPGLVPRQPDDRTRSTAIAALLVATVTCTGSVFAEQPDAWAAPRPGRQATVSVIARSVKPREPAGTAVVAYGLTRGDHHRVVTGIPVLKQTVPVREATHIVRHHDPAEADEVAEAIRRLLKPFHEQPDYSVKIVR